MHFQGKMPKSLGNSEMHLLCLSLNIQDMCTDAEELLDTERQFIMRIFYVLETADVSQKQLLFSIISSQLTICRKINTLPVWMQTAWESDSKHTRVNGLMCECASVFVSVKTDRGWHWNYLSEIMVLHQINFQALNATHLGNLVPQKHVSV